MKEPKKIYEKVVVQNPYLKVSEKDMKMKMEILAVF